MNRNHQAPAPGPDDSAEAERARLMEAAVHNVRMSGLEVSPAGAADAADYVAGRISLAELGRRTRARYGVAESPLEARFSRRHETQ